MLIWHFWKVLIYIFILDKVIITKTDHYQKARHVYLTSLTDRKYVCLSKENALSMLRSETIPALFLYLGQLRLSWHNQMSIKWQDMYIWHLWQIDSMSCFIFLYLGQLQQSWHNPMSIRRQDMYIWHIWQIDSMSYFTNFYPQQLVLSRLQWMSMKRQDSLRSGR